MDRHPLSGYWPDMTSDEFAALVKDVREHGVRDPIVLLDGQVLDGWQRYLAAWQADVDFPVEFYKGDDPAGFVISKHTRRSLSAITRARAEVLCRGWVDRGRPSDDAEAVDIDEFEQGLAEEDDKSPGFAVTNTAELAAAGIAAVEEAPPAPAPMTEAEMAKEAGVSARTIRRAKRQIREERGEVEPAKREPTITPTERLRSENDALQLRISELEDQLEEVQLRLQLQLEMGDQSSVEAKREETFNSMRQHYRSMKASRDEWMQKAYDYKREMEYWKKQAGASQPEQPGQ